MYCICRSFGIQDFLCVCVCVVCVLHSALGYSSLLLHICFCRYNHYRNTHRICEAVCTCGVSHQICFTLYVLHLYVVWNSGITICTLGSYPVGRMMQRRPHLSLPLGSWGCDLPCKPCRAERERESRFCKGRRPVSFKGLAGVDPTCLSFFVVRNEQVEGEQ